MRFLIFLSVVCLISWRAPAQPDTSRVAALLEEGRVLLKANKLDPAEEDFQQALKLYQAAGNLRLHPVYDLLAQVSEMRADLKKEVDYRNLEVNAMEASHDTADCDYHYGKLSLAYSEMGMYEFSEAYARKAYQYLRSRYKFCDFYGYLSIEIYGLIKQGKAQEAYRVLREITTESPPANIAQRIDLNAMYGNIYVAEGQYAKAEQRFGQMIDAYRITDFKPLYYASEEQMMLDHVYYYGVMGDFYIQTKQYRKAIPYVRDILAFPPGRVKPIALTRFYRMQFVIDSSSGNYVSAIRYFEKSKQLNDSLFSITSKKQMAEMEISYHTNQQRQAIKLLEMQGKNQAADLKEAHLQKNITFAGIAAMLLITGLAYRGYRNKQRSNRALQAKQAEINKQNGSLQQLLKEKEWLLKEVHHRVKNNLQIVISLLNTQTDYLDNPSALHAIQDSRERMQAIALIHQKLYQQEQSALIDMHSYIHELVSHLVSSFSNMGRIWFDLEIETIELDVSQAVPLGLVLNEAITNAVKYAFPKGAQGTIRVRLYRKKGRDIVLKIMDDGVGFPTGFDPDARNSLGFQLMRLFAEQLEGELHFFERDGVEINLRFRQQFS
ncbi:sensor histidine kinase [Puia sp.]|jgi:two-component sensor histidine kinase|uniref:tetratricopeptide repeat-containing sensor histidine kinase n=1 Tax=Puia sp. TaxID=2045100 RepID=UPI002F425D2C